MNIINIENYIKFNTDFDICKQTKKVFKEVIKYFNLKYNFSANVIIVSGVYIKKINKNERNIDKITDVLSFPNIPFKRPLDFKYFINKKDIDVSIVDLNNKTIFLGDIMICKNKVLSQAKLYGHSIKREYSFLIIHSLLHLFGFNHEKIKDEKIMFKIQKDIIEKVNLTNE